MSSFDSSITTPLVKVVCISIFYQSYALVLGLMRDLIVSTKWVGTYFGKDDFVRDVGYSLDHLFGSNSPSTRSAQGALVIAYDLCTNVIRWIGGEFMHPRTTTKNCGVHIKYVHDWSQVVVAVDRFNFRTSLVLWRKEVSKCSHNSWFF